MPLRAFVPKSFAAALMLAPLATRAQAPAAFPSTYNISGCIDGVSRFEPGATPSPYVQGRLACFGGTAALSLVPSLSVGRQFDLIAEGTLTVDWAPGFEALFVAVGGTHLSATTPACPPGCIGGFHFFAPRALNVGAPASLSFRASPGSAPPLDLASVTGLHGGLSFDYSLPNDLPGDFYTRRATITFTATPEPATVALTGMGGFALFGAARRRRART